ncbi:MAG: peptidylprolyl isomerase [Deltaproteobacteria bacterium]|nr:MAG: peptidylprolyl isomerase [Deltaproteobacteria bacterium]
MSHAASIPGEGALHVTFKTSLGSMTARLFEDKVPNTIDNFVGLATGAKDYTDPRTGQPGSGPYYDGTIFHRVIPNFMVQAGDPTGTGTGGPGYRFADEFHPELRHDRPGILSMANAGPNTNGSQFFITEVPTPHLDNRHSVFGVVVEGVELVSQITGVPRDPRDRPREDVVLESVTFFRKAG